MLSYRYYIKEALKSLPYKDMDAICAIGNKRINATEIMVYLYNRGTILAVTVKEAFRMEIKRKYKPFELFN